MNRWVTNRESTRPKTIRKQDTDSKDLRWLVHWLVEHNMTIEFNNYEGKSKEVLLNLVRVYRDSSREDTELVEELQKAMTAEDWTLL
jgi:hypothetical protein